MVRACAFRIDAIQRHGALLAIALASACRAQMAPVPRSMRGDECRTEVMDRRERAISDVRRSDIDFSLVSLNEQAEFMFRVAQLYWDQAECLRSQQDQRARAYYERSFQLCARVGNKARLVMPDRVDYCMGACSLRLGRADLGRPILDRLCRTYPDSTSCRAAQRLLGEMR